MFLVSKKKLDRVMGEFIFCFFNFAKPLTTHDHNHDTSPCRTHNSLMFSLAFSTSSIFLVRHDISLEEISKNVDRKKSMNMWV